MDERDLRKGNLVLSYGIHSIVKSCFEGWIECILPSGSGLSYSCSDAEPVNLTEAVFDWLGFGENQFMGYPIFEKVVGEYNVNIHYLSNKVGCSWRVHIDNDRFERIGSVDIQYVHELQNIIRLCTGCDLEVKLSKPNKNN